MEVIASNSVENPKTLFAQAVLSHNNRMFGLASDNPQDLMKALNLYQVLIYRFPESEQAPKAQKEIGIILKQHPGLHDFVSQNQAKIHLQTFDAQSVCKCGKEAVIGSTLCEDCNEELATYYQTLNIGPTATLHEIRGKVSKLLDLWNPNKYVEEPDKCIAAEKKQREFQEAFEGICRLREDATSVTLAVGDQSVEPTDATGTSRYSVSAGLVVGIIGGCLGFMCLVLQWPWLVKAIIAVGTGYSLKQLISLKNGSLVLGLLGIIPGVIVGVGLAYWMILKFQML